MDITQITIAVVVAYFALLIAVSYKSSRKKDEQAFIIGNRQVGVIPLVASMAAGFRDASGAAIWVGTGFAIGYGYLGFVFGVMISSIILGLVAPTMRKHSKKHNYITVGEMLKTRLGSKTAMSVSVLTLILMAAMTSGQFYVLGNTMAAILEVSAIGAMAVTALVIGIYLYMGGFSTVVKTDVVQFCIIVAFIVVVFFIPLKMEDVLAFETIVSDKLTALTLFGFGLIMPFCFMDFYQKIFAAKDDATVKKGIPLVGPFVLIMTISLIFLGMSAKNFLPSDTVMDTVMFEILKVDAFPSWIIMFLSLSIIAMTMSTIDTYSYVFSSTLLEDFKKVDIEKDKKKYVKYSRIAMIVLLAASVLIASGIENFVQYIFGTGALIAVLGPMFLGAGVGLFPKSKKMDMLVTSSVVISTVVFFVLMITTQYAFLPLTLVPFAVNTVLVGISWLICRKGQ
ncbi:MAG: hypothetical protein GY793_00565 [Proteobacteria bacterium]|nr:hypothetical protein [Pseudomonadota bacterium]